MSHVPTGRDNGLPVAQSYVPLVDVDPPVADQVLELLRIAGVPAVAEPLAGETGPYRDVRPPPRPTERIHVDRLHQERARTLVAAVLPALRADFHADAAHRSDAAAMRESDIEREFAAIVSTYDEPTALFGPWPVEEDLDDDDIDPDDDPAPAPEWRSSLSARLVRRRDADEEPDPPYWPEDHFVPPVPPRLPRLEPLTRVALAGVVGGPLVLLLVVVLDLQVERVVVVAALAAFMAGLLTLVVRMPGRGDDDDDGAVV